MLENWTSKNNSPHPFLIGDGDLIDSHFTSEKEVGQISDTDWLTWQIVVTVIPMSLIILEVVLGNLLVVTSVLTQSNLRTPANVLIVSLAITDLAVGLFVLPFNIADMIHGWRWGPVLCKLWLTSDVFLSSASVLHICAIAVDRFRSVNEGVAYYQSNTTRMSLVTCGMLYIIALWVSSAPVLGWNDWKSDKQSGGVISCHLAKNFGYVLHSALGALIVPTLIMVAIYFRIFFLIRTKLHDKSKISCVSIQETNKMTHHEALELDKVEEEPDNLEPGTITQKEEAKKKHSQQIEAILVNRMKHSLKKERKAAKRLGLIIGAFVLCWTPFIVVYLANGVVSSLWPDRDCFPSWLFQAASWLAYANSGVNPIIYTMYSSEFKKAFIVTLKRIVLCRKTNPMEM